MRSEDIRATIAPLLRSIEAAAQGWTIGICSRNEVLLAVSALLLEPCRLQASSIAEFLAQPLPQQGRLLLLCDDECPDGGVEELLQQLRGILGVDRCRTVAFLAADVPQERLERIWRCGVEGMVSRPTLGRGALVRALLTVLRGHTSLDPLLRKRLQNPGAVEGSSGPPVELSPREQELILAVARGHTSRQIAALQQLRSDTVRRRLSQLYRRVGVRNQRALVAWGLARGLIRQPDLAAAVPAPDDAPDCPAEAAGSRRRWAAADR